MDPLDKYCQIKDNLRWSVRDRVALLKSKDYRPAAETECDDVENWVVLFVDMEDLVPGLVSVLVDGKRMVPSDKQYVPNRCREVCAS